MHMVMHLLVKKKSAQNDSTNCELEEPLYVAIEGSAKMSL